MVFQNWYAPRAICSPSRAALLSGRDPVRYGDINNLIRIFPSSGSRGGFPQSEKTTAEYLRDLNYSTGYSGKWHLGLTDGVDPYHYAAWNQGFEEVEYFVEGSNGEPCPGGLHGGGDDNIYHMCWFSHVLRKPGEVIEQPIRWENSTARELVSTLSFMERHAADGRPWFFMHAFTSVHVPWKVNRHFVTDPVARLWTDQVRELDWAVGVLLDQLGATGQAEDTVVVLTSDNGPYLEYASSECPQNCRLANRSWAGPAGFGCTPCSPSSVSHAGPLSGGKGQTWEGGVRVPGIWRWPGRIAPGSVSPLVAGSLDFLPTAVALAGGSVDDGITLDGRDISSTLLGRKPSAIAGQSPSEPTGDFFYWCGVQLMAVRIGRYKVAWYAQKWVGGDMVTETRADYCAGTGKCCAASPTRLCTCSALHNFTDVGEFPDMGGRPVVMDLVLNAGEDLGARLDPNGDVASGLVDLAAHARVEKLRSVARDRGIGEEGDAEALTHRLAHSPDLMAVDFCVTGGGEHSDGIPRCPTPLVPPMEQLEQFKPYEDCVAPGPSAPCRRRFPCCQQEGYTGPYEYVIGGGDDSEQQRCGCFKQPGGSSLFPETRLLNSSSVRAWQLLEGNGDTWRKENVGACWAGDSSEANARRCTAIGEYGLNVIPTGFVWNEPYMPPAASAGGAGAVNLQV